jgi:hypothetical protein
MSRLRPQVTQPRVPLGPPSSSRIAVARTSTRRGAWLRARSAAQHACRVDDAAIPVGAHLAGSVRSLIGGPRTPEPGVGLHSERPGKNHEVVVRVLVGTYAALRAALIYGDAGRMVDQPLETWTRRGSHRRRAAGSEPLRSGTLVAARQAPQRRALRRLAEAPRRLSRNAARQPRTQPTADLGEAPTPPGHGDQAPFRRAPPPSRRSRAERPHRASGHRGSPPPSCKTRARAHCHPGHQH